MIFNLDALIDLGTVLGLVLVIAGVGAVVVGPLARFIEGWIDGN